MSRRVVIAAAACAAAWMGGAAQPVLLRVRDGARVDAARECPVPPFRLVRDVDALRAIEAGAAFLETDRPLADAFAIPLHDAGVKTIFVCTNAAHVQAAVDLGAQYVRTREPDAVRAALADAAVRRTRPVRRGEFRIRDPYVFADPATKTYYLYETASPYAGAPFARGVDVRTSTDLETWSPPVPAMRVPTEKRCRTVWAPEVHAYNGAYYLFATLSFYPSPDDDIPVLSDDPSWRPKDQLQPVRRGTWVYRADSPAGPFVPVSDGSATPRRWMALDGTLLVDGGKPYMVFCHEWVQTKWGRMDLAEMTPDLARFVREPTVLFDVRTLGPDGGRVTDGCFCYRSPETGKLYMIWSPVYRKNYAVFCCESASGRAEGPWVNQRPLFEKDGGHGMIFRTFEGALKLVLHRPNRRGWERLAFFDIAETAAGLTVREPAGACALPAK